MFNHQKNYINTQQDKTVQWENPNQIRKMERQKIFTSKEIKNSISDKPNLILSIAVVAVAFVVVPILPIVLAVFFGHWLSKSSNKRG